MHDINGNKCNFRLLYVEDNYDDAYIFLLTFQKIAPSIEVVWLKDGQDLMDYLDKKNNYENREEIQAEHFLILDINMPRVDGFEALKFIKTTKNKDFSQLPVIMFSTSAREEDRMKCQKLGADEYIAKPHYYEELISTIENLVNNYLQSKSIPLTKI
jgi:CheY-like chemotaxis protein